MGWINTEDKEQTDADGRTMTLAGLAVVLFMVVVGLFLIQRLARNARIEDCLLSGRRNCDVLLEQPTDRSAATP